MSPKNRKPKQRRTTGQRSTFKFSIGKLDGSTYRFSRDQAATMNKLMQKVKQVLHDPKKRVKKIMIISVS